MKIRMLLKFSIVVTLLLLIFSCHETKKLKLEKKSNDSTQFSSKTNERQFIDTNIDTTIVSADSVVILGEKYKAIYKTDEFLYVINAKGDTIVKEPDLHYNFEFDDFDGDHLKDIRINYMSNVPAVQNLLLFDKVKKTFLLVKDFENFPDPKSIKGSKYYYSYHRSGCADMNWGSDLFYIDHLKAICIGTISGRECGDREEKDGIYIYKVKNQKERLIKEFPISSIRNYKDYKWGFIEEYWKKNYNKFTE